jgi:hypothetical protein
MDSKKEKEKKTQNHIKDVDFTPLVRQNKNRKNRRRRNAVSDAAAIERICFTSPGCGRRVVELIACGAFIKKLPSVGFNSGSSIPEFPCKDLKACCLSTTACGKSSPEKIYLNEKKSNPHIKYVEIKMMAFLFWILVESIQANNAGISITKQKISE